MACLTYTCWNTIGLAARGVVVNRNSKVGNNFSPTLSKTSNAYFFNGRWLSLSLLTARPRNGGCGASFGPQIFNSAGTITYKVITGFGFRPREVTLSPNKTWSQCGVGRGIWNMYAVWTPNRCAKRKGFVATKSYPVQIWVS